MRCKDEFSKSIATAVDSLVGYTNTQVKPMRRVLEPPEGARMETQLFVVLFSRLETHQEIFG